MYACVSRESVGHPRPLLVRRVSPVSTAYLIPTDVTTMNYNSVILVGVVFLTATWWLLHAIRHYPGPKVMTMYIHEDNHAVGTSGGPAVPAADEKKETTRSPDAI